jgi:hypothetical protein
MEEFGCGLGSFRIWASRGLVFGTRSMELCAPGIVAKSIPPSPGINFVARVYNRKITRLDGNTRSSHNLRT